MIDFSFYHSAIVSLYIYNILNHPLFSLLTSKGEYHGNNPEMSKLLHKAVREKSESAYSVYQQHLANRPVNVSRFVFLCLLSSGLRYSPYMSRPSGFCITNHVKSCVGNS